MKPQLHLIDGNGEVVEDGCPACREKDDQISGLADEVSSLAGRFRKLEREHARITKVDANYDDILEVMSYWRERLCPNARIVVGSKSWNVVKVRLAEQDAKTGRQFSVLELKAAVVGVLLDPWCADGTHRHRRYPEIAFSDPGKVTQLIGRAVQFKRTYGASALEIVDELAGPSLVWLAERCSCGHLRLDHVRQGPTPDGRQPCADCDCPDMDRYAAMLEARWAELQQSSDPQDRLQVIEGEFADGKRPE